MIIQLLLGSAIISVTIAIQAMFIGLAIFGVTRAGPWLVKPSHNVKLIVSLIAVALCLLAGHTIGIWIWALTYLSTGTFETLEPALYFSIVACTTLGFGDITLPVEWRILSALSAANGLLLFGLSTAFLVEFMTRLRHAQENARLAQEEAA